MNKKQGSRNGAVVRVLAVWVQFQPSTICGLSSLLVLALLRGFFSAFFGFLPSTESNIVKFQFDQDRGPA